MENQLNPNLSAELSEIYAWTIDFFGLQQAKRSRSFMRKSSSARSTASKIHAALLEHAGNSIYAIPYIQDSTPSFHDTTGVPKSISKHRFDIRISSRFSGDTILFLR
jgi:hypothetical protein